MTVLHKSDTVSEAILKAGQFRLKDPWSAITHLAGFLAAIVAMPMLMLKGYLAQNSPSSMISYMIYMLSMILLYGASASYHSFNISEKANMILKKIDHLSIFLLIAGTYTPVCLIALDQPHGYYLLAAVWTIALAGIIFKLFYVTCPKWVSSVIYTAMGWVCIFCLPQLLHNLSSGAFFWLLAGGILYSVGAVFYAIRPKWLDHPHFGNHEVFHCFVLAGSICHFIVVCGFLTMIG